MAKAAIAPHIDNNIAVKTLAEFDGHCGGKCHGFGIVARVNSMTGFVAILAERVRRLLDQVGYVTRTVPGTRPGPYLGSDSSVPVFADIPTMVGLQRRDHPDAFALVSLGQGLDGIAVPRDEDCLVVPRSEPIPESWLSPGMFIDA